MPVVVVVATLSLHLLLFCGVIIINYWYMRERNNLLHYSLNFLLYCRMCVVSFSLWCLFCDNDRLYRFFIKFNE